jgi:hypothetical protein
VALKVPIGARPVDDKSTIFHRAFDRWREEPMIRLLSCLMLMMFGVGMLGCEARGRVDEPRANERRVERTVERYDTQGTQVRGEVDVDRR